MGLVVARNSLAVASIRCPFGSNEGGSNFLGLVFSTSAWGVRLVVAVVIALALLNPPLGPRVGLSAFLVLLDVTAALTAAAAASN